MVWSTGTTALEFREIALHGGLHDIEATCKRDIVLLLLRRLQGRSRRDLRCKFLPHSGKMVDEFAQLGRLKGAGALLSTASRTDLPQSAISMPLPEDTLPSSIPYYPLLSLHRYLLASQFDFLLCGRYLVPSTLSRPSLLGKHSKPVLVLILLLSLWGPSFRPILRTMAPLGCPL